ncbi:hypothetical protein TcasGA2_TC033695 [Tribolium castaneum]|uniref:Uncharacterized protein n=1 Tax=Tribolium castaneum TaxID=7070 RepID=A0A139WEA6_TRICA|nr:hypothetical protein TcasGA2_TC033695 [Tribolium castaneum]
MIDLFLSYSGISPEYFLQVVLSQRLLTLLFSRIPSHLNCIILFLPNNDVLSSFLSYLL